MDLPRHLMTVLDFFGLPDELGLEEGLLCQERQALVLWAIHRPNSRLPPFERAL